jgi:hypothetical protein
MKKFLTLFILLLVFYNAFPQKEISGKSSIKRFVIKTDSDRYIFPSDTSSKNLNNIEFYFTLPPILSIEDITFSENVLDAEESAKLSITLKNSGPGDAKDLFVELTGGINGLSFPPRSTFPIILANGGTESITIEIKGEKHLPTSEAIIKIEIVEPNFKVKIQGKQLKFPTREFLKPELILAKYAVIENQSSNPNNQIEVNEILDLKIAVQNIGQGAAEIINISVTNNQVGVMLLGVAQKEKIVRQNPFYSNIQSGKFKTIVYRYFVNSEFNDDQLEFTIKADEKYQKYGFSETKTFPINRYLEEEGYIRTIAAADNDIKGEYIIEDIPDFVIDVDVNIPETKETKSTTYALIIGNEDYKSRQTGLTTEQNVDYAVNDALVFSEYCKKTSGIPERQIMLLKNATAVEIHRGLSWINNLAKIENGNAELIFYYSGHGLPNEKTREPYIIPVDVSGFNLEYAIKLSNVYAKLTEHPANKITVFMDACFSGGARNQELISLKNIRIEPKESDIKNNLVVFTSSTGEESSSVFRNKHHGYFTYFLLKKLQQSEGNATYDELSNYIIQKVRKETGLIGKIQTPEVKVSPELSEEWKNWKLR